MSWYDHYFTPEWEKRFRYQSSRLFANHPEKVDDAFQTAWTNLFENLQKAKKKDMSDAYVMTAFKNLLTDEYRHQFGRCRPRGWVKKLGVLWERVAVVLCQENLPVKEITQKVKFDNEMYKNDIAHEDQVNYIVSRLKAEVYCSTIGGREEQEVEGEEYSDNRSVPENNLPKNEMAFLLQIILGREGDSIPVIITDHIIQKWQPLSEKLDNDLTDNDRLVLILVFTEGYSVAKTARTLNKSETKIRYQLKQVLAKIQSVLKQHDIDLSVLVS